MNNNPVRDASSFIGLAQNLLHQLNIIFFHTWAFALCSSMSATLLDFLDSTKAMTYCFPISRVYFCKILQDVYGR